MTTIHPKTSGAAVGASLGIVTVAVLGSIHGVHLTDAANAAIPTFLGTLFSWLTPAPPVTGVTGNTDPDPLNPHWLPK